MVDARLNMYVQRMVRPYRQTARAVARRSTHDRIVDAAESFYRAAGIGPPNVSTIAKRAGVQRLTLYRHFPGDDALLVAVLGRWRTSYTWPRDVWSAVADPRQRMRVALEALYGYYGTAEPILTLVSSARDRSAIAAAWLRPFDQHSEALRARLATGWSLTGRPLGWLQALIRHSLEPTTWRSLVRDGGLSVPDAARLMARSAAELARDPYA